MTSKALYKTLLKPLLLLAFSGAAGLAAETPRAVRVPVPTIGGEITDLAQTADGVLWLAGPWGLAAYDGTETPAPDLAPDALQRLQGLEITAVHGDSGGYLWIGTGERGLLRFDGRSLIPTSRPGRTDGGRISTLLQDRSGTLWIGTPGGLLQLEESSGRSLHGLPSVDVQAVTEDPYGHVWVSVGTQLLRRVRGIFQNISLPLSLESSFIHDLAVDENGTLWLARDADVLRLGGDFAEAGLPQTHDRVEAVPTGRARRLAAVEQGVWIGTDDGRLFLARSLGSLETEARVEETPFPGEAEITDLVPGRFGGLWIAARDGLFHLPPERAGDRAAMPPTVRIAAVEYTDGGQTGDRASTVSVMPLSGGAVHTLPPGADPVTVRLACARFGPQYGAHYGPQYGAPAPVLHVRTRSPATASGRPEEGWRPVDGDTVSVSALEPGTHELQARASWDGASWGPVARLELVREAPLFRRLRLERWAAGLVLALVALALGRRAFHVYRLRAHERMVAAELEEIDSPRLEDVLAEEAQSPPDDLSGPGRSPG